jgi:hypothetical protein
MKIDDMIYFTERNRYGAVVVYGIDGVKQYYGYSVRKARKRYLEESRVIVAKEAKK